MADDQQADIVEEIPQAPMPSADQTPETQTEEVETSPKESEELPVDTKARTTEQFNKLKRELAEEREKRTRLEKAYTPPALPQWYDPSTGVVDANKLQQREQTLLNELQTLKQQVTNYSKVSEAQQEKEAYAAYPELKTNERFHEEVIRKLATEFAIGNNPTMKEAADSVMDFAKGLMTKAEKEGARKALEQLAPKEQASLEATGRSDRRPASQDLASLSRQSRYGGDGGTLAILARLKNVPSV